ncbi:MAG: hypothetical protein HZB36_06795 [Candidatus Omnitrophica bacterium]|nr:hypothetical protein [Candidatus Omnitrophota bacterium]
MQINGKLPLIFGVPDRAFFEKFGEKKVFVAELRPGLEGMQAVSKGLLKKKITPVVICDNMMAFCMRQGLVSGVHIFYKNLNKDNAVCRTGSLIAALCAKEHNIPVYIHKAAVAKVKISDLRKIGGRLVTNADLKTYCPVFEDVPLELANIEG